jgi:hypothetical protein
MANSNRVFVSPGVYTSEKDLTFVAQSVGVTTLGLAGETIQGPAFEPILIRNFDEFKTYFGPTSPTKYADGNPKYELGYVAKSYLQESNQLFVTRVLGLTGYKPVNTFSIKTLGGITVNTNTLTAQVSETLTSANNIIGSSSFIGDLNGKLATDGSTVQAFIENIAVAADKWFTIGSVESADTASLLDSNKVVGPIGSNSTTNWYNVFFKENGLNVINGVYGYLFVYDGVSAGWKITQYEYPAVENEYAGQVVVTFRSRGSYSGQTLNLEVTSTSNVIATGSSLSSDPLGEFTLDITGSTSGVKTFTLSLDQASNKYVTKVLGTTVFGKDKKDIPLYVGEVFPETLKALYEKGLVRGLNTTLTYTSEGNNFVGQWETPASPVVVSEVRGGTVNDLFNFISISDGNAANTQVKITFQNIDLETGDFDIVIRDFNDKDDNQNVLEKFTRCTMSPDLPGYVARKIGTSDGEYELRSKYVMLNLSVNAPVDAVPAGFKGYNSHSFGNVTQGSILYKTKYNLAGDVTGYTANGESKIVNADRIRKVSLGISSQIGFDSDILEYKGDGTSTKTYGFHLSTNASTITGDTTYHTTSYDLEGTDKGLLENKLYRKFTLAMSGGFDGWDIYRGARTNGDGYVYGKNTYVSGNTNNGGVFSTTVGNSDYYAYQQAIETFSNPESVDINIFATPGIDFVNHSSLVNSTIEMIEGDRADSLYIINPPNTDTVDEIIDQLDIVELDSNYSATYWPWIQVRDTENATQIYLPPTGEVLKNIALTDNVSYPWFAVAGYSRGLVNAIKAKKKLTLENRDDLYKARINPIATFSDTGTIIWGNKTLQVKESALDRINVRRLLLRARKLISAVAVRLLFEQNDEQVRNEFLRLVNPILESIKKERGLYEFRVVVSNDPEDLDANTLRGKIYIKPTRALEFIDVEFLITPTGASFENI